MFNSRYTIVVHPFMPNLTIVSIILEMPLRCGCSGLVELRSPRGADQPSPGCGGTRLPGGSRQLYSQPKCSSDERLQTPPGDKKCDKLFFFFAGKSRN